MNLLKKYEIAMSYLKTQCIYLFYNEKIIE